MNSRSGGTSAIWPHDARGQSFSAHSTTSVPPARRTRKSLLDKPDTLSSFMTGSEVAATHGDGLSGIPAACPPSMRSAIDNEQARSLQHWKREHRTGYFVESMVST